MWRKADRVAHPLHGPGVVESLLVLGKVRVVFDNAPHLPRTVHGDTLVCLRDQPPEPTRAQVARVAPAPVPTPQPSAPLSEPGVAALVSPVEARNGHGASPPRAVAVVPPVTLDAADAWQTLEAIRLGVVPARGVRDYTVARDTELSSIDAMLAAKQGCRVVWGDYGAGKTHLLEAAEQLALERGYAVVRVTLDPVEYGLHHPLRLYQAIADRVRTLDHAQPGIEHVLDRLADSEDHYRHDGRAASRFFSPYLYALRFGAPLLTEYMGDYVRGLPLTLPVLNQCLQRIGWRGRSLLAMSDFRTYGRMYTHLIGTLAAWCQDAGLAGLALCFDEVERVDTLGSTERQLALEVFQHIAAVMMVPEDLAFDPEQLYRGGQDVHRGLPLRFRAELPLVGVFALTPLPEIEASFQRLTHSRRYDLHLAPLGPQSLRDLVQRIAALYERAYPSAHLAEHVLQSVHDRVVRAVRAGDATFRVVVRAIVLSLDAARSGRSLETPPARTTRPRVS